jgi:hypothetical protein
MQETNSSVPVTAILTQPALLVAIDETKCAQKGQIKLELPISHP